MDRKIPNKQGLVNKCPECGLHYEDKAAAQKCEAWCSEHKSCNLEITQFSVEATKTQD